MQLSCHCRRAGTGQLGGRTSMRSGSAALWRAGGKQRQLNGSFIVSSFAEQHCSAPLCPRRCEAVDSREGLALTSLSPSGVSPHATTPAPKLPALYLSALAAARQWTHERAWHSPASHLQRTKESQDLHPHPLAQLPVLPSMRERAYVCC